MKLLHTGDWHLGKVLKGFNRLPEQTAVMTELVEVAAAERVDAVLIAGDVFETAAPSPEAQQVAWRTLMALRATGAEVLVIAGNHDNPEMFEAVRPVFAAAGITLLGKTARPADGGVVECRLGGELLRVALVPFVSQRGAVRATQLFELDGAQMNQEYADSMRRLVAALTAGFRADAVNVVLAHAFVQGGKLGGGERDAQTVHAYSVSSQIFPAGASYVALGHLHRSQEIGGPCPIRYPGSPIAVDFGEEDDSKGVLIIEASAGLPVRVEPRRLVSPRRLRTVEGSLAELTERAASFGDDLLRVIVTEAARSGLAGDVRAVLPHALEVRVRGSADLGAAAGEARHGRPPHELFGEYLHHQGIDDQRLVGLFRTLYDDEAASSAAQTVSAV